MSRSAFEVATKTGNKITLVTPTTVPTDYLEGLYVSVRNAGEDDMSNERAPGGGADDQFLEIQRNADGVAANVITLDDAQTIEVGDSIYLAPMLCGVMFQEQRTRYQMVLEAFSANIHDETIDFQPAYSGSATNMHETNGQPIAASVITADDTRNVLTLDETMKSTTRVYFKSNDLDIGRGQIFFPRVSSKALALSLHWTPGLSGKFIIADPKIDLLVDEREPGR